MRLILQILCAVLLLTSAWAAGVSWWVPIDVRQQEAAAAAPQGPYAAIEAVGFAEARWWLIRFTAPLLCGVATLALLNSSRVAKFLTAAIDGLCVATQLPAIQRWLLRGFLGLWAIVGLSHAYGSVVQRLRDWPSYRLLSGQESLPNISVTNRQVIRYVKQSTPPGSRILVLSDQKLFFLSYYLQPRRLYHPLHPDSEFVIPLAYGERTLAAYTREDLDQDFLDELNPDYVLEYFENKAYIDPARVTEDANWLTFLGGGRMPSQPPAIQVVLRPHKRRETP